MAVTPREKILRYYRGSEQEEAVIRCLELVEQTRKTAKFRVSPFLNEAEQAAAQTIANHFEEVAAVFLGGYPGAERKRAVFVHSDFKGDALEAANQTMAVLKASWRDESRRIGHRDVLGTMLGMGFDRSVFGDFLVSGDCVKIICDLKIAPVLKAELNFIGGVKIVAVEDEELASLAPKEERVKEIRATVASLRIDSIAGAGFGMSRTSAAEAIEAEKVQVNWQKAKSAAQAVKAGDVISLRGRGRVEVVSIGGTTKKGRTVVELRRYL